MADASGTGTAPPSTVLEILRAAADYLQTRGVDTPRLDAELLLAEVLGLCRLDLYVQFDRPLTAAERDGLREGVRRRGSREPVALILGSKEFRSLEFELEPGVLIPRPDTELLAELAVLAAATVSTDPGLAVDLGTGSGILAISVALESSLRVLGVDASPQAVHCARDNLARLGPADRVGLVRGDWWDALPDRFEGQVDLLVSNPPYVSADEHAGLAPEIVRFEPRMALVAEPDALTFYRRTADGLARWMRPGGRVLVEVGLGQAGDVERILTDAGVTGIQRHRDLADIERVVEGTYGG